MNESTPATSNCASNSLPQREKYWGELSDAEKIERTRSQVKHLSEYQINQFAQRLSKLESFFHSHQHSQNGKIVAEIDRYGNNIGESVGMLGASLRANQNPDETYF